MQMYDLTENTKKYKQSFEFKKHNRSKKGK